jgi:hypothetical protein
MKGGAQSSRFAAGEVAPDKEPGRSRADDHEMLMASLLILAIWLSIIGHAEGDPTGGTTAFLAVGARTLCDRRSPARLESACPER